MNYENIVFKMYLTLEYDGDTGRLKYVLQNNERQIRVNKFF